MKMRSHARNQFWATLNFKVISSTIKELGSIIFIKNKIVGRIFKLILILIGKNSGVSGSLKSYLRLQSYSKILRKPIIVTATPMVRICGSPL